MGASTKSAFPHVLRIETMSLDLGELAVVVELDQVPSTAWTKALGKALGNEEGLEEATARFDGRFVYVVGLEPGLRGAVQRVSRALATVQGEGGARGRMIVRPAPVAGEVAHA